jgi:ATP-dependent Clp protease ATP-binding subunit ClpC
MHVEGGIRALDARARRAAKALHQPISTAHLLLVMLQDHPEASRLLGEHGVSEREVLSALKTVEPEHTSAFDRVLEWTARCGRELGVEATFMHVLLVVTSDTRSRAYTCLSKLGVAPDRVHRAVRDRLGLHPTLPIERGQAVVVSRAPAPEPAPARKQSASQAIAMPRRTVNPRRALALAAASRRPGAPPRSEAETPPIAQAAQAPIARGTSEPSGMDAEPPRRKNTRVVPQGADAAPLGPFDLDKERFPFLTAHGRNLTALASRGEVDPLLGREREIGSIFDVLARRRSNNPLLVGPPGAGKTALVEGLACVIARGEAPRGLEGRIIVDVPPGALVSGTGVRGALAEKMRKLREEVARADGRVVLFLDEIHVLFGGEGADDVGAELKTVLSRGELPCIGATTDAEHRKYVEKDPALARRFSRIEVDPPSPEVTKAILRALAPRYEQHHAVAYTRDALEAAVELSVRFIPAKNLPDKAISVMDLAASRARRAGLDIVDRRAIAEVVSEAARVPVDRLLLRDGERLLALEQALSEKVVGHTEALARIADTLRKGAAGLRGTRPLGSLLLLGPTGVGKTETAKAIADVFFGGAMTRLDMSEYAEPHTIARLLGAPPGYVGHDAGGQLTEAVRARPYQLVLLDEIEKAHVDVWLSLLPLLDEGRLTDGRGRTIDFTSTIVVMTSNLGVAAASEKASRIGFGANETKKTSGILDAARRALPPELWNRIDEPLVFGALTRDDVREIARRLLAALDARLVAEHGVPLEIADGTLDALADAGGFDATLGARPMRRTIGRLVEGPLAKLILGGDLRRDGTAIVVEPHEGSLRVRFAGLEAAE